jgi:hypothetical protein
MNRGTKRSVRPTKEEAANQEASAFAKSATTAAETAKKFRKTEIEGGGVVKAPISTPDLVAAVGAAMALQPVLRMGGGTVLADASVVHVASSSDAALTTPVKANGAVAAAAAAAVSDVIATIEKQPGGDGTGALADASGLDDITSNSSIATAIAAAVAAAMAAHIQSMPTVGEEKAALN